METGFENFLVLMAYFAVVATLIFTVDDLFIDFIVFIKHLRPTKISADALFEINQHPQKKIAILLPYWKCPEVIAPILRANIETLNYENYIFYLGVHSNDLNTWIAASKMAHRYPQKVRLLVSNQPGPRFKGAVINEMILQVIESESQIEKSHDIFLLQEKTDLLHPQVLSLVNFYIDPSKSLQLPSWSLLSTELGENSPMDHLYSGQIKDLMVRETLGAPVSSAISGVALPRKLVNHLLAEQSGSVLREKRQILGSINRPWGFHSELRCFELNHENGMIDFVVNRKFDTSFFTSDFLGIKAKSDEFAIDDYKKQFSFLKERKGTVLGSILGGSVLIVVMCLLQSWASDSLHPALVNPIFQSVIVINIANLAFRLSQKMWAEYRVYNLWQSTALPFRMLKNQAGIIRGTDRIKRPSMNRDQPKDSKDGIEVNLQ